MGKDFEFLGWDCFFGEAVIDWLWERREELPHMLVLVPTAQSGRCLREGLAERGGTMGPRVVTAGALRPESEIPRAIHHLAWIEALESISNWDDFSEAFPIPPNTESGYAWALSFAKSFTALSQELAEEQLTISTAAKRVHAIEAGRWKALAELEKLAQGQLKKWGMKEDLEPPSLSEVQRVIVAGVTDLSPRTIRVIKNEALTFLYPGNDEGHLDEWGRPKVGQFETIDWPTQGGVWLSAEPSQQAEKALELVAEHGHASSDLVLGSTDPEVSDELVQAFSQAGWPVFDPGRKKVSSLVKWLKAWRAYLRNPEITEALNLLAYPQSGFLVKGKRAQRALAISQLREAYMIRDLSDVSRLKGRAEVALVEETLESFDQHRQLFLSKGFHMGLNDLLFVIDPDDEYGLKAWLSETQELSKKLDRSAVFWMDLLLSDLTMEEGEMPEKRVLDVQGWMELLFSNGSHLVLCGMNEGLVPSHEGYDPWLTEGTRRELKINHQELKVARDLYLFNCLLKSRRVNGRVDLLLGKVSQQGDMLKPSRLLLMAKGEELAKRVRALFREVEASDLGLAFELEPHWRWQPRADEKPQRMNVSGFSGYLACPYRYYLKQVLRMRDSDSERQEWNARDFGNLAHWVLETWARDEEANSFDHTQLLESWVHEELDRQIAKQFGQKIPISVKIQREAMRQRLAWFAQKQAEIYQEGWRVIDVEKSFKIEIDGMTVSGQVDRIDQHEDGRIRVLDYKTRAKPIGVVAAHQKSARSRRPAHLEEVEAASCGTGFWTNLQVPLYATAFARVDEIGYFSLGATEASVGIDLWEGFDQGVVDGALQCARWVIQQVKDGVFWPPEKKVTYDDYEPLALGRNLEGMTTWEGGGDE